MVSRAHLLALLTVIPLAFSSVISFGSRLERADEELGYLWKHVAHLDSAVDTFDGSFGHNAEIQKAASSVVNAFSKSTLAIREVGRIRRADIDHILSFVEEILPTLNHALGKLGAKKREIDVEGTPVKDLVPSVLLNELRALKTNTVDFAAALVKICPVCMSP
ncbi:hypothetical protein EST38_g11002 [Candolleomyces aberdarensis]|uniref:Uncharacterized protein n=1 Tax=Candolleomyces aberdarensis TaxID=2316362 RepID=A0A4V1Q2E9_9AGAR|nr:hypothetical protein EST38_g11002 [Candolleomyces aberdarensis]